MAVDPQDKARRQQALLVVLGEERIETQAELRQALTRRGFRVTQATLSRDLKELRVPSVATADGRYRYLPPDAAAELAGQEPAPQQLRSVASLEAVGIESNETAVVVRTLLGRAQGVAVYLDGLKLEDQLATIAGDDTILVLPKSVKHTKRLQQEISRILGLA